jgi:hypothetical protein
MQEVLVFFSFLHQMGAGKAIMPRYGRCRPGPALDNGKMPRWSPMDKRACSTGVYGCFLPVCDIARLQLQLASPLLTVIVINKLITSLEKESQVYFHMQAAVIDHVTAGKLPDIDSGGMAEHLRSKFSNCDTGSMLHRLGDAPKLAPGDYLRI